MKVGLIYDAVYPYTLGGVEHRNHQIALQLVGRHQVTLYGFHYWSGTVSETYRLRSIGAARNLHEGDGKRKTGDALRAAWGTFLALQNSDDDVWDIANIPYFPLLAARLMAWWRRKPLVTTWHEFFGPYWSDYLGSLWRGKLAEWVERLSLWASPVIIAVSSHTYARILTAGYPRERLFLVPNGIDLTAAREAPPGPPSDWIYAGRLTPHKRLPLAIRAFQLHLQANPEAIFRIIGDGPERTALEQHVSDCGLSSKILFDGFLVSDREVASRMKGSKIAVLPSEREGFGLAAVQAWACGLPTIVCDEPENAMKELVNAPQLGRVVASTPEAIAQAAQEVQSTLDAEQVAFLRLRASEYDLETMVKAIETIYMNCQELK